MNHAISARKPGHRIVGRRARSAGTGIGAVVQLLEARQLLSVTGASSPSTSQLSHAESPFDLVVPASPAAGVAVHSADAHTVTPSIRPTTELDQLAYTPESDTPSTVTVPADTISTSTSLTDANPIISLGGSTVFTSRVTPAIGGPVPTGTINFFSYNGTYPSQVEPVQSDGTASISVNGTIPGYAAYIAIYSGDSNYAASTSGPAFSAVNVSPLVPTIAHNTLASSILTNASAKGVVTVTLKNTSASTVSGIQGINIFTYKYLGGQSASSSVLGTLVKSVTLAPGASRSYPVKIDAKAADGVAGLYYLLATVTNQFDQSSFSETAGTSVNTSFTVAPATVTLSATSTPLRPSAFGAKPQAFSYTITVKNTGNEDASGTLMVAAEGYNDTYPLGTLPVAQYHFPAHIKVGKSQRFTVHAKYLGAGTVIPGTYNLQLLVTLEGASAIANVLTFSVA